MSKQPPFYLRREPTPRKDPAAWLAGFETEQQASERYAARGRLMFTRNSMSQPKFYWCTPQSPCDSAACPKCMRAFRRWLVDVGIALLEQQPGPLCVASLVHHTLSRPPGRLHEFDLDKAKRQLARHLDRAALGDRVAIDGFDFCYCVPFNPTHSHWQPHAYVVFQGIERRAVKKALNPFYPKTPNIPRPIKTREVDCLMEALSYSMKAIFGRRISYRDNMGSANTRSLPLSLKEHKRELPSYLDQRRPVDRLFLKNVRREGAGLMRQQ